MDGIEWEITPMADWLLGPLVMRQFGSGLEWGDTLVREILVALLQSPFQTLDATCLSISTTLLASGLLMLAQHIAMRLGRVALRIAGRLLRQG